MKNYNILLFLFFAVFFTNNLWADIIEPGDWFQTSSTAGDSSDIIMSIIQVTPHIVQLDSNNGWVGYAWYSEIEDEYSGFFELIKDTGIKKEGWTNQIFKIKLVKDNKTVSLEGINENNEYFTATFRIKQKL